MKHPQYPEYFYINADRTVICSVDNEITRADFGALKPVKLQVLLSMLYNLAEKATVPDGKGGTMQITVYPMLDEAVEKTYVRVNALADEQLRFAARAQAFVEYVCGREGNEYFATDQHKQCEAAYIQQYGKIQFGDKWYHWGNVCMDSFVSWMRTNHPEITDLQEPI